MNFTRNKTAAIAIAILLIASMSASMITLPTAVAHTPAWKIPTYAYIWAAPNPVGVGQAESVFMWLTNYYYGAATGGVGGAANNLRFHNYKLTITAPNGVVTTQTFATITDTTSNQHASFVPDQAGTYNLTFTYPGETYTTAASGYEDYVNDTFLPSVASTTVTVQETPIANALTGAPLPTAYWTRPIYGENTNWYNIGSNWLGTQWYPYAGDIGSSGENFFPGDAVGPLTSHIMWTNPLQSGGIVGGNQMAIQGQSYFDGSAYINRYINPIIMAGMLYYTEPLSFTGAPNSLTGGGANGPTVCVNLQTGQQIWSSTNVPALSFGYLMDIQNPNEHGVCPPLLISASYGLWQVFDGDTGTALCNVTNVPYPPGFGPSSCMPVIGPDGEYLNYVFTNAGNATNPDWTLGEWNSSLVFNPAGAYSPTLTGTINGDILTGPDTSYDWSLSLPWLNTMTTPVSPLQFANTPWLPTVIAGSPITVVAANYGDGILCINGTTPSNGENDIYNWVSSAPYTYFFVNLNASRGAIGSVLWWSTIQPPPNNYTVVPGNVDWNTRMFFLSYKENVQWLGYSLNTGQYVWTAPPQSGLDYYGNPGSGTLTNQIAYGNLYSSGYSGTIYCYNDLTGKLLWTYGNGGAGNSTNAGLNNAYGDYPTQINAVGNGVLYTVTTAHTWTTPIYKGALARAINATTGQEIWTLSSITAEFIATSYAIADGYATWFNGYDNSIYVVGRGPSATTATAQAFGNSIVIKGSVTDISAGTKQTEQAADFPNGVPVASDASMKEWMGYVYQQQPMPTNFTGVTVTLSVLDSNKNFRTIGTATTDASGMYSLTWTPDIPGNFTVYASFAGTNGYWSSSAETSFAAISSPATPTPTVTAQSNLATTTDLMLYIVGAAIAIIIAIAIVGVLMLRKRP